MTERQAYIPYGVSRSTPFARWQGAFQHLHSREFAARFAKVELGARGVPLEVCEAAP